MKAIPVECTVISNIPLTPTVFEIKFKTNSEFTFKGGQFISIIIPGAGPSGRDLRRAYSIASSSEEAPIELCIKLVENGPGTNYLYKLKAGDVFKGMVPYGDFCFEKKEDKGVCFIATGTGIAPFRSMLRSKSFLENPPKKSVLLLGVREEDELLYVNEFSDYPIGTGKLHFAPCVSRPKTSSFSGFKGRVTDYLRSLKETGFQYNEVEYYLCGGGAMIDEVKTILAENGVAKEAIHVEVYYKEPK